MGTVAELRPTNLDVGPESQEETPANNDIFNVFAALCSIAGLVLGAYVYLDPETPPQIRYTVLQEKSLGSHNEMVLCFWNSGKTPITHEMTLKQLTIDFQDDVPLQSASLMEQSSSYSKVALDDSSISNGRAVLNWQLLERSDNFVVRIVSNSDIPRPTITGAIRGQKEFKFVDPDEARNRLMWVGSLPILVIALCATKRNLLAALAGLMSPALHYWYWSVLVALPTHLIGEPTAMT